MDSWYDTRSQKTYFLNPKTGENKEIADRNFKMFMQIQEISKPIKMNSDNM
jgi:hypothetical protein